MRPLTHIRHFSSEKSLLPVLHAQTSQTEVFNPESITLAAQNNKLIPANFLLLAHMHKIVRHRPVHCYCPLFQPLLTNPEEKKISSQGK